MAEKSFTCPVCGVALKNVDEAKLIKQVQEHAKHDHKKTLSEADVKKGIKESKPSK